MKKTFLVFAIFSTSIFFNSCSDDSSDETSMEMMEEEEEEETEEEEEEEEVDVLAGKIGGDDWTYKRGKITQEFDGTLVFELYGQEADESIEVCDLFLTNQARIKFFIPSEAVGVYEQPREIATQSVRFFPSETNGGATQTAVSGTVELTSVEGTTIEGIIDARADDDHFVVGAFTATKCY